MDISSLNSLCTSVPGRYSKAIFESALERNTLERTLNEIMVASKLLEKGYNYRIFILRIFQKKIKPTWLNDFFNALGFQDTTLNFLYLLAQNKRINCLPDIVRILRILVNNNLNKESITVFCADDSFEDYKEKIFEKLYKIFNKKLDITFKIKESIIGGIVIQSDCVTIDASVNHQIETFSKSAKSILTEGYCEG